MIHCMFMIQSYGIVIAARFQVNTNANMAKSGPSRPFNYSKHKSCPCKYFSISLHLICQTLLIGTPSLVYILRYDKVKSKASKIILVCRMCSMFAQSINRAKNWQSSIERFSISWRNTTAEQYSLWHTAGRVRGRLQSPSKMSPSELFTTALKKRSFRLNLETMSFQLTSKWS